MPTRVGQHVAAGEPVAVLHDARRMWLRLEPVGAELGAVTDAVERGAPIHAVPLIAGTGPELEDLRIERVLTRTDALQPGRGVAIAECRNIPINSPDGPRSWRLRAGLRYVALVPATEITECFVLPRGAVTPRGADRVVLRQSGNEFEAVPVRVVHEDADHVVIAADGALQPGADIAMRGALALSLALQLHGDLGEHDDH